MSDAVEKLQAQALLVGALFTLLPREERVLRLHFGMYDGPSLTLAEIADQLGLSCARVAQIERRAFRRLKFGQKKTFLKEAYETLCV